MCLINDVCLANNNLIYDIDENAQLKSQLMRNESNPIKTGKVWVDWNIKTSSSESWGQEEAASTHICIFRPMQPLQRVIYTDGWSKFLKCYSSATNTAIA